MSNIKIPQSELQLSYSRSSGAGGQNVNKLNTKATLKWDMAQSEALTDSIKERFRQCYPGFVDNENRVQISSQKFRTQGRNTADCIKKLHSLVASVEKEPKKRRPTKATRASKERRLKQKRQNSEKKNWRKSEY